MLIYRKCHCEKMIEHKRIITGNGYMCTEAMCPFDEFLSRLARPLWMEIINHKGVAASRVILKMRVFGW